MTEREAIKLSLVAFEEINKLSVGENAICLPAEIDTAMDACRKVLAQPEPVIDKSAAVRIATALGWEPKRKPLTDEEITEAIRTSSLYMKPSPHTPQSIWLALLVGYARAIEAKLKEKNNG